jgi:sugar phosphate isomerase/epimerase
MIGGSLLIHPSSNKEDIELQGQQFKSADYDYAELGSGLLLGPIKTFKVKLEALRNILPILSCHLPQIDYNREEIERCKKVIEILSDYGTQVFVIHLYSINLPTKDNLEFKIKKLNELVDFTKSKDVILSLENTEEDLIALQKVFNKIPEIDFCLDVGHANLLGKENQAINFINKFEKLLKHIHIHDNIGGTSEKEDLHLPIGEGKINFKPIFERLKEIVYSGSITIELNKPDFETKKLSFKRLKELIG